MSTGGPPRGTGLTEKDPGNAAGHGRGKPRGMAAGDADPVDAPGQGRGRLGASLPAPETGVTDADVSDMPFHACNRLPGMSPCTDIRDGDPADALGSGRGRR
ncbi:hypothetical protein [Falsiroseomonas oryzae]|uniref:hypothetical protein n=1 Tax=Falsiroseomonas oryzae TaxID=2766473 RepID=UPI0022EB7C92|nr:hypothetical protein [Roseomonas sp. MO-31]